MSVKLLTYDVYRSGMTLFKNLADETYQDKLHLPEYFLRKVAQAEVPAGFDSAYRLIYRVYGDPDEHVNGDTIGIMGSKGGGVIQSYIVGETPYDPDWFSDEPDGLPFIPSKEFLYLILTPGNMYNCFFRYDETALKYVKVLEATGDGAIFSYEVAGKTPFDDDWLSDEAGPGNTPLEPKDCLLYLDMSPGKYQNYIFRFDAATQKYIPISGTGSGIIFAYEVTGKTPFAADWLTDEVGGSSITPDPEMLYLDVTVGKYENYIFRFNSTQNAYVPVSGGSGGGAIFSYIVGSTAYASNWLSDEVGGAPLDPEEGYLYLVLTAGQHYSAFYRYDATNQVYILVGNARVVDITKADYLNLPVAKQNDGTIYFITDSASSAPGKDDYVPSRVTAPTNPALNTVILWKGAITGDFTVSPAFYEFNGTNWVRTNLGIEGQTIQVDSLPTASSTFDGVVLQYIGATGTYQHNYFYECIGSGANWNWVNTKVQPGDEVQVETMPAALADLVGKVVQYIGTTTASYTHNFFYECVNDGGTYSWVNARVQSGDDFQVTTMPTASSVYAGRVLQYVGTTDSTYTHDYFYECIEESGVYSWINVKVQPGDEIQVPVIPTASLALVGKVFQYIGTTDSTYTHNYFYECINDSGVYRWINTKVQPGDDTQFPVMPTAAVEYMGKVVQFTGATAGGYIHNYFYECVEDSGSYSWVNVKVQPGDEVQVETMPTASADYFGKVLQFVGVTDSTYTHNYFYECTESGGVYSWTETIVENPDVIQMSLAEFNNLTQQEKDNGQAYFIPDANLKKDYATRTGFTPIGTVIPVVGDDVPTYYVKCDGSTKNIVDLQELADYFEDQFGSVNYFGGDGTTTFAVPNLVGGIPDAVYCIAVKNIQIETNPNPAKKVEYAVRRWLRFDPANKKGLIVKAGTKIRISDGTFKTFAIDTHIDLSTDVTEVGKDYFVFLADDGSFSATTTKVNGTGTYIGRFHTLCVNAGTITMISPASPSSGITVGSKLLVKPYLQEDDPDFYDFYNKQVTAVSVSTPYDVITTQHPLSGFEAGDILPESVFCLSWKPKTLFEDAMVYDPGTGIFVDIYLQSGTGFNTRSAYNATHTVSRQAYNHLGDMLTVGKKLLSDHEFTSIALGSNECTVIQGSSDKTTVGGHVDTAGTRMISAIGCEECCGYLWQWTREVGFNGQTKFTATDGKGSFGKEYGTPCILQAGGHWTDSNSCGSRTRNCYPSRSFVDSGVGGRGCSVLKEIE